MIALSALLVLLNVQGALVEKDVGAMLQAQMPRALGADSLRWSLAYPWAALGVPAGATEVRLVPPATGPRPGLSSFTVQVLREGQVLRAASFAVRCERVGRGLKLRRTVRAGESLNAGDVEEVSGVLPYTERPLASAAELPGSRMRCSLPAGTWLPPSSVERTPPVRHGAPLQVSAAAESFVIRFQAVAQQEGFIGDVIRARGPRQGQLLKVKITAAGMADLVP